METLGSFGLETAWLTDTNKNYLLGGWNVGALRWD